MIVTLFKPRLMRGSFDRESTEYRTLCRHGQQVTHDRFGIADILFKRRGGARRHGYIEEHVIAITLFSDLIGQPALAPNLHLVYVATRFGDPGFDALEHTVKSGLVQVRLDDTYQFIIAHGMPPFHGIALVLAVGGPGAEGTY